MKNKDTSKILEELNLCEDFKTFYKENRKYTVDQSLAEMLTKIIEQKGFTKKEVIKRSELSEPYGYQILSGVRNPERAKLLSITVGMGLSLDETQKLLKCAGYSPLYVKIPFDSVVLYGIFKGLSVVEINSMLFECGLDTLG